MKGKLINRHDTSVGQQTNVLMSVCERLRVIFITTKKILPHKVLIYMFVEMYILSCFTLFYILSRQKEASSVAVSALKLIRWLHWWFHFWIEKILIDTNSVGLRVAVPYPPPPRGGGGNDTHFTVVRGNKKNLKAPKDN